jgi:acyl carrier protein
VTSDEIRTAIRSSVNRITGISSEEIQDTSSYRDDLGLDSLSMLELTVDIEYAFKIKVPEERLQDIRTVNDTIQLVQEFQTASAPTANAQVGT